MSDQRMLLLVLIVIYLSECFVWVGHGAVVFRAAWRRFRVVDPPIFPGNDRGGWAMLNPLPPMGAAFVCSQWPVVMTAEQVGPQTGQSINFRQRPPTDAVVMNWTAAGKLEGSGSRLSLGGVAMMHLPDEPAADHYESVLGRLATMPADRRPDAIARAVRDSFDTAAIEKRLAEFWRRTWLLRTLGMLFFCLLFILLPLSVYLERFVDTVYRILPMLLVTWLLIGVLYFRVHLKLLRPHRLARWKGLVTMIFAPTASIRACDVISRHLLTGYDPVAVAAVLLDDADFETFVTRAIRDLADPLPAPPGASHEGPAERQKSDELATAFRQQLLQQVTRVAATRSVSGAAILAQPKPADAAHRSYCPRCRLEYLVDKGTCRDCGERKLEPFALQAAASA